jgi:hypothetical protein
VNGQAAALAGVLVDDNDLAFLVLTGPPLNKPQGGVLEGSGLGAKVGPMRAGVRAVGGEGARGDSRRAAGMAN